MYGPHCSPGRWLPAAELIGLLFGKVGEAADDSVPGERGGGDEEGEQQRPLPERGPGARPTRVGWQRGLWIASCSRSNGLKAVL